jgi:hypothetical protein
MNRRAALATALATGLFVLLALDATPALALVCRDQALTLDEVVDAIKAAPGCERAMKVFEACELGTSGDVRLGAAVEANCEADFLGGLTARQKAAYQREMRACDRRYRNQIGTMHLSFTAFCRAEVAQRYARQAPKAIRASR